MDAIFTQYMLDMYVNKLAYVIEYWSLKRKTNPYCFEPIHLATVNYLFITNISTVAHIKINN